MKSILKFLSGHNDTKKPTKISLINVHDYPKSAYTAYWDIRVTGNDKTGYGANITIYSYSTGEVLDSCTWSHKSKKGVDTAAQEWVIKAMKKYKRES